MNDLGVNNDDVFVNICCAFIRTLYCILNKDWEEIIEGLVVTTSSDSSKCSYHLLYAPVLLVDGKELIEFTNRVIMYLESYSVSLIINFQKKLAFSFGYWDLL